MRPFETEPFSAEERSATLQRRVLEASRSWRLFFSEMPSPARNLPLKANFPPNNISPTEKDEGALNEQSSQ